MAFGGYRTVWVIVMFDLPTDTKKARREYTKFRKRIMEDGFVMMQFSVYARHCASEENSYVHTGRVRESLPPDGEVRVITITDKQFGRMQVFYGKKRKELEWTPQQITLF